MPVDDEMINSVVNRVLKRHEFKKLTDQLSALEKATGNTFVVINKKIEVLEHYCHGVGGDQTSEPIYPRDDSPPNAGTVNHVVNPESERVRFPRGAGAATDGKGEPHTFEAAIAAVKAYKADFKPSPAGNEYHGSCNECPDVKGCSKKWVDCERGGKGEPSPEWTHQYPNLWRWVDKLEAFSQAFYPQWTEWEKTYTKDKTKDYEGIAAKYVKPSPAGKINIMGVEYPPDDQGTAGNEPAWTIKASSEKPDFDIKIIDDRTIRVIVGGEYYELTATSGYLHEIEQQNASLREQLNGALVEIQVMETDEKQLREQLDECKKIRRDAVLKVSKLKEQLAAANKNLDEPCPENCEVKKVLDEIIPIVKTFYDDVNDADFGRCLDKIYDVLDNKGYLGGGEEGEDDA